MEKRPSFQADMAGLGKYHMGGYGRIGVHRVKCYKFLQYLHWKCVHSIQQFHLQAKLSIPSLITGRGPKK